MKEELKKPPLGIIPKKIHDEKRFKELCAAIKRYQVANLPIPAEWWDEYYEFTDNQAK